LRFVRHIHGDGDGLAARALDLLRRCLGGILLQIGNGDFGAVAGIGASDLQADAAGGAGDDGDFVFHSHGLIFRRFRYQL